MSFPSLASLARVLPYSNAYRRPVSTRYIRTMSTISVKDTIESQQGGTVANTAMAYNDALKLSQEELSSMGSKELQLAAQALEQRLKVIKEKIETNLYNQNRISRSIPLSMRSRLNNKNTDEGAKYSMLRLECDGLYKQSNEVWAQIKRIPNRQ